MSCARLAPESEAHAGKAFAAASTAASTSASDPFGTVSTTSPFAGLRTSSVFPLFAPTVSPAINMLVAIYEILPVRWAERLAQTVRARRSVSL